MSNIPKFKFWPWEIRYPIILILIIGILYLLGYIILLPLYYPNWWIPSVTWDRIFSKPANVIDTKPEESIYFLKNYNESKFLVARSQFENGTYTSSSANIASYNENGELIDSIDIPETYNLMYSTITNQYTDIYSYNWDKGVRIFSDGKVKENIISSTHIDNNIKNSGIELSVENENWSANEVNVGVNEENYLLVFNIYNLKTNEYFQFETFEYNPALAIGLDGNNIYFISTRVGQVSNSENTYLINYDITQKKITNEIPLIKIIGNNSKIELNYKIGIYFVNGNIIFGGFDIDGNNHLQKFHLYKYDLENSNNFIQTDLPDKGNTFTVAFDFYKDNFFALYSDGSVVEINSNFEIINSYKINIPESASATGFGQAQKDTFIKLGIGYITTNRYNDSYSSELDVTKFDIFTGRIIKEYKLNRPKDKIDGDKQDTFLVIPL